MKLKMVVMDENATVDLIVDFTDYEKASPELQKDILYTGVTQAMDSHGDDIRKGEAHIVIGIE